MSIHAVWGPPQSGKTTLAIDLAFALSSHGQSVLLISTEQYSEMAARLNIHIPREKSIAAAYKNKESLKQIVYKVDDLFFVLAQPSDTDVFGEDLTEEVAKSIIQQADTLFDIVLVDCASHTGSVLAAWGMSNADQVLMLCGANSTSILWYTAFRRAVAAVEDKSIHVASEVTEAFDYLTLYTMLDVEPDNWLPHFPGASMVQILKRTLYQSNGKHAKVYTNAIDELCEMLNGEEDDEE